MADYMPPLRDMAFLLHDVLRIAESPTPGCAELDPDTTAAILEEAGRIARDVLAPDLERRARRAGYSGSLPLEREA